MTTDLREALSRIEAGLAQLGRGVLLRALRPGLGAEEVGRQLTGAGLPNDSAVASLYGWRNGSETEGVTLDDIQMFPGFYLLSLEDAVTNYRAFDADQRWSPGWLPIFANGGGDFYLVDLGDESPGMVRHFRIEEAEHPIEFRSLPDMMTTLAAGFDRGVFYVDPHGSLEMDDVRFAALAKEVNPSVP